MSVICLYVGFVVVPHRRIPESWLRPQNKPSRRAKHAASTVSLRSSSPLASVETRRDPSSRWWRGLPRAPRSRPIAASTRGQSASAEPLATLRHGGVFGAQGALLGVPSLVTARVVGVERGATLLMLGGGGLTKLRSVQPALERRLLASAAEQQQQITATLERRSALWRRGGWKGPDVR